MAASTRLKGNVKAFFSISSASATPSSLNPSDDLIDAKIVAGDGDPVTMKEKEDGYTTKAITVTATYSGDSNSLYFWIVANRGKTASYVVGPHGNGTYAVGKPVFTASGTVPSVPDLELPASVSDPVQFEVTFQCDTWAWTTA